MVIGLFYLIIFFIFDNIYMSKSRKQILQELLDLENENVEEEEKNTVNGAEEMNVEEQEENNGNGSNGNA